VLEKVRYLRFHLISVAFAKSGKPAEGIQEIGQFGEVDHREVLSKRGLTRTSSAAASESARGCGLKGFNYVKAGSTTARRQLQRVVRWLA
jgi:hypothetical protein